MIEAQAPDNMRPLPAPASERMAGLLLWVFIGAIFFSLGGVLAIKIAPGVLEYFGPYFETLVRAPTWTYMAVLPLIVATMYESMVGVRRTILLVIVGSIVGAGAELLGTTTGFPFGEYRYTDWLGPKILGHVPYFIPLSWYAMGMVCYDLAGRVSGRRFLRVVIGALFMVGWDVSLDPAMSRAFPFWTYGADGFFYGMPVSNWGGWFLTSFIILGLYSLVVRDINVRHRRAPLFFFLNCFFPFTLSLQYGLYTATVAGAIVTATILLVITWRSRGNGTSQPEIPE